MPEHSGITESYITDAAMGDGWTMLLGDSCERLAELNDQSVDLSVHSPPFSSLYTYSPSPRDLGNCGSDEEFVEHYRFVIEHLLRVTKPGRLAAVHITDLTTTKATHGVVGCRPFSDIVTAAYMAAGWTFCRRITVDKNPQAAAIRTKAHNLMFQTLERDSSNSWPALADYVLLFRAPGENQVPVKPDVSREEWITWAHPVWYDISETAVLNVKVAREEADERHICPLQLPLIERCVRLWSNPGELVLSPFAGIGSEGWVSVKQGRCFTGVELKASYWRTAVENLRGAERQLGFDFGGMAA
jgi:DNA modification methylase